MSEAKTAGKIDVLRRRNPFLHQPNGFDHENMQQPVHRETRHVLHPNRRLADLRHDRKGLR